MAMEPPQAKAARSDAAPNPHLGLAVAPLAIALNLSMGTLVHALKLPVYLDAIGTIIATLLLGFRVGATVGVDRNTGAVVCIGPPDVPTVVEAGARNVDPGHENVVGPAVMGQVGPPGHRE